MKEKLFFVVFLLLCDVFLLAQNRTIVNTSFEQPAVAPNSVNFLAGANASVPQMPGWENTHPTSGGVEHPIEVWGTGFNGVNSIAGNQFIEINAYEFNRLYQTVCLITGETINWHYYHRGRAGVDVMNLSIYDLNGNLLQVLETASTGTTWTAYDGSAVFTGNTGSYQLSFEAISSAGGSTALGNFLDDVNIVLQPLVEFAASNYSDFESVGGNPPQIIVNGTVPAGGLTVSLNIIGGSATAGEDYTLGATVFIPAGDYNSTSPPISLPLNILTDLLGEPNETIIIELGSVLGGGLVADANCSGNTLVSTTYTIQSHNCNAFPVQILGDNLLCAGQSASFSADVGSEFQWSTGETTQSITIATSGTYSLTVTDANGCTSSNFTDVVVSPNPTPQIVGNNSICPETTTTLALSQAYLIYIWSTGSDDADVSVASAGTYTVTVYDSNACSATSSIVVTAKPAATASLSGATSFCEGGSTDLGVVESMAQYAWSNGENTQHITVNTADTYTVTVTNSSGCTSSLSVSVSVGDAAVSISGAGELCGDAQSSLVATAGYSQYLWSTGSTTNAIEVGGGTYSVTVSEGDCVGSASVVVTAFPSPQPQISGNLDLPEGGSTELVVEGNGFVAYNWSSGGITAHLQVNQIGTYTVTVTDANACTGTASAVVRSIVLHPLAIPNAFSPNQDDANTTWGLTAQDVSTYQCYVYDRWGIKVFESHDINERWDGKDSPMGVYAYFGEVVFSDGTSKSFKGNLSLIR